MTKDQLSDELRDFIVAHFDSIESIELILLLRNAAGKNLTAEELNASLRSHVQSVIVRLEVLSKLGLVKISDENGKPVYHFECANSELNDLMCKLAEQYIVRRFSIINVLYDGNLRSLHQFSDAFSLRKRREDDNS